MILDVYFSFKNQQGKVCPGVKAYPKTWAEIVTLSQSKEVSEIIDAVRAGDKSKKTSLPSICFTGHSRTGHRRASDMEPTQLVMIDIDHVEEPRESFERFLIEYNESSASTNALDYLVIAHITPSGHGLRLVFKAVEEAKTLPQHMETLKMRYHLDSYGDFDSAVHDFSRISFMFKHEDLLYVNTQYVNDMLTDDAAPIESGAPVAPSEPANLFSGDNSAPAFSDSEKEKFEKATYRGKPLKVIVEKYLEVFGMPGDGETHNYYNEMVKNFRCICDNDKRLLAYVLPLLGQTLDERWRQIVSICRVNTLSRLPKPFYFFLKDNGFYEPRGQRTDELEKYMLDENEKKTIPPPYLPPVFRELVGSAPTDFVIPAVNALLPILGTLSSYLGAYYPYDGRLHTTSFFSVIYAPPGTGKGFVERFLDLLFEDLRMRDYVQSERENVYLRVLQRKGANDKAPDMPHVSLRLIPPKNSEAEFLQKQRDNQGYHMFTYAAEMDSWAKGVKAAGGNKDDMIRIAWDNGEYGQQFKSANTFKGTVNLFWNVLITGTVAQVDSYFKNVENGLVTRCSFTEIENQEFSMPAPWKKLTRKNLNVIRNYMKRCDENTYECPCTITSDDLLGISDEDFDKEVDWRFKFKERQIIDMNWLMPTINNFHKEQMEIAARDIDRARDVFRRRVGVRGFRLGLLCYSLWGNPRESDLLKCVPFIDWWMHRDLECMLKLWGAKYNEQTDVTPTIVQRTVFDSLPSEFSRNDVYTVCLKQGIKTPVRRIVFDWKKLGYIKQIDKEHFTKK